MTPAPVPMSADSRKAKTTEFYVGYGKRLPDTLRVFLPVCALLLVITFAAAGLALGVSQTHPGESGFRWDLGQQTLIGVLELEPAPIVHARPNDRFQLGHTMMLTGQGKVGVQAAAAKLAGRLVEVKGFVTQRGALDMLVVDTLEAADGAASQGNAALPPVEDLGRWRMTGEICDGKCAAGAMRPGRGIAHKACANLCIDGGAPPVFVANGSVAGKSFFLMADEAGRPLAGRLGDVTAGPVEIEARVQARGDLLIVLIDPKSIKRF